MTSTDLPRVKLLEFQVRTTLDFYQNQVKLSRCLIYKVQSAVFEDFSELFEALYRSRWQLIYYIRFISVCQELFSFLFKLFRPAPPLTEAAYLVYQTEKRLSRSFFISCRTFPVRPPLTEAAWLVYYPIRLLSTPFSIFFAFSQQDVPWHCNRTANHWYVVRSTSRLFYMNSALVCMMLLFYTIS